MTATTRTPAALGYRMPAEWERQEAVWLSWPVRRASWPGAFRGIPGVFGHVAARISERQKVRINAAPGLERRATALIAAAGGLMANVEFYPNPTNDAWCRDHGPIFISNRKGGLAVTDWGFNAWGGKYSPCDSDDAVPGRIARELGLPRFRPRMVLEGGSIDVNGRGLLLTTESCLLNPNRNPRMGRRSIEARLAAHLGVTKVLWLGAGIAGDDTDGHVDDLARFFSESGILAVAEDSPSDVNYRALRDNLERLRSFRTPGGRPFRVVELPMPEPCYRGSYRLPASYANFLIINGAVLMPTFGQRSRDRKAAEILASCFPGREIVPIDCLELVWGLGTLHCISQQQPAARP
ncbi:MAG TPA: agmatine deiminase family protein [Opitutaceae bacterium]|jgi:agmatine deiminase